MSTLKTTNLQNADASSANIVLGQGSGGGATISGVTTSSTLRATTGIVTSLVGGSARFTDDGSASPTVSIQTDDATPYALNIGNQSYSADTAYGLNLYNNNSGEGYFRHVGNSAYLDYHFSLHNNSSNKLCLKFEADDQSVELFAAGSKKFETTETGTVTTGISTATHFAPSAQPYGTRNYIINGDMRIVQRGASTTTINSYIIDRWRNYGGPADATWSRQIDATAYPRSRYALRQQRTSGTSQTNNTGVGQGIETKNSYALAGQAVTLTFKARCGANFSAASNQLTSRINGGEGTDQNPFSMTNTNGDSQNNVLTTSVQTFTHKWTIPSDKTQVTVMFDYNPVGTAGANDWFEVAEVQLEVGSVATPFEYLPFGQQLALCQRYFTKSYDYGTYYTDTDSGDEYSGALIQRSIGSTSANILFGEYPVPMRAAPTVTVRGPTAATDAAATIRGSGNTAISVGGFQLGNGPRLMGIYFTSNQANSYISAHYYADAEL
tara:strand:- start:701 stop:2185 length:1485 start_codon:yes stop_codon:yes gene_type:complete